MYPSNFSQVETTFIACGDATNVHEFAFSSVNRRAEPVDQVLGKLSQAGTSG